MIHERENREDLEAHLKQNGKKFSNQCVTLMIEMYKGRRLSGPVVEQEFKMNSRRLRNCIEGRPDVVKRGWRKDILNNTTVMEYWIDIPMPETKKQLVEWAGNYLEKKAQLKQQSLF